MILVNYLLEYIELDGWKEKTKNKRIFLNYHQCKKVYFIYRRFCWHSCNYASTSPEREGYNFISRPF